MLRGVLSLTRRFSGVAIGRLQTLNRFNGLPALGETVKAVTGCPRSPLTPLKRGVNENGPCEVSSFLMNTKLSAILVALLLLPCAAGAWSGDTWANITREMIKSNADKMIDSTWYPKNTFTNWAYSSTYYTYYQGTRYTGVAYTQNNPQETWAEFSNLVSNTAGGSVSGYGNDCSGFTSICWKLPNREVTSTFESKLGGTAKWYSLGDIGSASSAPLVVGDGLNSASVGHIVMFVSRYAGGVNTMEQTPSHAQRKARTYSNLAEYRPIRRMQIVEDRGINVSGPLNFGDVMAGTSAQLNLTIFSTGQSNLTVSSLSCPAGFSGNWSGTIAPGGTHNVTITFSPTTMATYSGTITVNSDAIPSTGSNTVAVSGTGTSSAPQITSQPRSQTVIAGQTPMLVVGATGTFLTYQWRYYGTDLSGATTSSLVFNGVTASQSGPYAVVVTNISGAVTSQVATLTVEPVFPAGGWSALWSLAPTTRYYLASNSPPDACGLAVNPVTGHLLLVNHTGPHVRLLDADSNADLGELSTSGVNVGIYMLQLVGVADDGVVYAGNLTYSTKYTAFQVHRWANDDPATVSTLAYSGDPGAGAFDRWGDTFAVRGAGTNTQIIVGARTNNFVAILTTTDETNFASKLITVADAPIGAFAHGVAFGDGDTFWGKATSQALRQVAFDLNTGAGTSIRVHADPAFPGSVGPIGVYPQLNLLAGINVGATGNNLRLYDLTPTNGTPVLITSTNFAADNNNTLFAAGAIDFLGDRVYALGGNNGLVALQILPAPPAPALPGHFDAITRLADGSLQLSMSGSATTNYVLQATTDWVTWSNVCTLSGANGQFWWTNCSPTAAPCRFYRLRLAP